FAALRMTGSSQSWLFMFIRTEAAFRAIPRFGCQNSSGWRRGSHPLIILFGCQNCLRSRLYATGAYHLRSLATGVPRGDLLLASAPLPDGCPFMTVGCADLWITW